MLTKKQLDLLDFISKRVKRDGVPPSFDEMKEALDLRSKSGIHRLITALEERGFIRRLPHRARALEIIKLPDTLQPPQPSSSPISIADARPSRSDPSPANGVIELDVMGRIAAGTPISAIEHAENRLSIPQTMVGAGEHYALEVNGDSMIDAGINDGDMVIICKGDTAQTGDIVVALVDDHEATLKRFRRQNGRIALEAANPNHQTQIYRDTQVRVQGKLVGLMRSY